jgi:uncharacterized OB-fold protein
MGFDRFGVKSFVSETKAEAFVDYLQRGKVMTTKCTVCGTVTFPPKMHCPKCRSSEVEWVEIKETGELVAFTTVMYGPAGFENHVPYTLAAVKFPNGLRIFGEIDAKMPNEQIMEGMKLRVVPVKLSENRVSYQFQKA